MIRGAMELRHLRSFLTVAEERHFGRAAARLGIAQPPLSRQIQSLEAELGVALFDRSRRQIELTAAGAVLADHARRLLAAAAAAEEETRRAARGESGHLVIGYVSSVAYSGLTEILRAYRARHPGVEIALREGPPQLQIDALKARRIDVGFVRGPLEDATLRSVPVIDEALLLAMPSDHPLRRRRRIELARCADEPFIIFPRERGQWFYDRLIRMCRDAGFTPRIAQEAPGLDIVSLVAVGLGIAIVPASWRSLRRSGIVFRPIEGDPRTELLLAWQRSEVRPVVQGFIDLVRRVGVRQRS
jgi:DNA-binding transcriptional LysR family regulator